MRPTKPSRLLCFFAAAAVACSVGATSAQAVVTFQFNYTDMGFSTEAQQALDDAAAILGAYFDHTATVQIDVTSSNDMNGGLASAGPEFVGTFPSGFSNRGIPGTKILGGADANGAAADGSLDVNFFHNWDFDDVVASNAFDFKSTIIHELAHAVGFLSGIGQTGDSIFAGINANAWVPFDEFVGDNTGVLIDPATFVLNQAAWNAASVGGAGNSGLLFYGPNAMAANGGNPVPLYSPNPWEDGSSGGHLDDDFFTGDAFLMESSVLAGPAARSLSPIEMGIFRDLGFTIVPEPGTASLLLAGLLFLRRRRR